MPSADTPEIQMALDLLKEEVHQVIALIEKLNSLIEKRRPALDSKAKPS
jgi:hypothetical protein